MPRHEPAPGPDLLTPAEVADLFRVSAPTVTRWARQGRLHVVRTPSGRPRFHVEEVHTLMGGTATT